MPERKLTINEIKLSKELFGDSIKYGDVKIFNEKFAFFQPDNSGMTPNGNIYVDGNVNPDYGAPSARAVEKAFFIHDNDACLAKTKQHSESHSFSYCKLSKARIFL